MKHRRLGRSGLYVSDICMGTMTFGSQTDEKEAFKILDASFDAGINFYDTAENYPVPPDAKWAGRTEEIFGRWLKTKPRDAIIVATKVSGPSHGWIKSSQRHGMTALDRHNIRRALEASLTRLGTDYVDLYQTHWPDHGTAFDETLETLDELIREGLVRIIGSSNEDAWGTMKAVAAAERLGTARYQTIQNNFSLNNRRFEDALSKICEREGISLIPYSPIGGGVLSGKYQDGAQPEGARFSSYLKLGGRQGAMAHRFINDKTLAATARYMEIAKAAGVSPVTLATAWSKQHSFVASTIVGAARFNQLADILAAADLELSADVMAACDQVSKEILYPMG
jgi:aryl-alcohol dehydrogenase-like predicted oxidoreductase